MRLRRGGRQLGGSLTWEQPQNLAAFAPQGPFAGLPVPDDVVVSRQVLAEPNATLAERTWASLRDGTPLVTGVKRGKGVIALFHVSADSRWSDLPLSGTFVEMLRRIVDMSGHTADPGAGVAAEATAETLAPLRNMDGFGVLGPRRRPRGRFRPIIATVPAPIIRPAFMDPPTDRSPLTHLRPQTGLRPSTIRLSMPARRPIPAPSRETCADWRSALRLHCS